MCTCRGEGEGMRFSSDYCLPHTTKRVASLDTQGANSDPVIYSKQAGQPLESVNLAPLAEQYPGNTNHASPCTYRTDLDLPTQ